MDDTTIALLTGLVGSLLGTVLIGGAMAAAFLIGKERGRREAREALVDESTEREARLIALEEKYERLLRTLPEPRDHPRTHLGMPEESSPIQRR